MKYSLSIFSALVSLNLFVWYWVVAGAPDPALNLYFLKSGEGDSELAVLPGGVKVLIDGGPSSATLAPLGNTISPTDRYLDVVLLSHPQLDHFGGLIPILERYKIGLFVWNGESSLDSAWKDLVGLLNNRGTRAVVLKKGDAVRYKESRLEVLAPSDAALSANPNDDSMIVRLSSGGVKALFTGDATASLEQSLVAGAGINADILKVSHHGSKTSSITPFLESVLPRVAVIEVGKNTYGHPAPAAVQRLAAIGASVYRTDQNGTVHIRASDGLFAVSTSDGH